MAQFMAGAAAAQQTMQAVQQGIQAFTDAENATAQGINVATEVIKHSRPEDLKKNLPKMLSNVQGNDPFSGAIRVMGAYEGMHEALKERMHPTDNLLNGTNSSLIGDMFKELAYQIHLYFCNEFSRMFQQHGQKLKEVIVNTVRRMLQETNIVQEYVIPGLRSVIRRLLESPETQSMVLKHLRGPCYIPETAVPVGEPGTPFFRGGDGPAPAPTAPRPVPAPTPAPAPTPTSAPLTPLVEIDYMDSPDQLKQFICNAYQRMFVDQWSSIRAVTMTSIEGMIREDPVIRDLNRKLVIDIINVAFDAPSTKAEFVRYLSGGCAIPSTAPGGTTALSTGKIVYPTTPLTPQQRAAANRERENPGQLFTKYLRPSA
uniref:Uncharacterized protein n=1 Tax=viral metagenome TaxID=1070528 RepID=A0A6C0EN28_9ZZZZ